MNYGQKSKTEKKLNQSKLFYLFILFRQHAHLLKYVHCSEKNNEAYLGGFSCDECKAFGPPTQKNLFCAQCGYDLCDNCFDLDQ